ncbi:hypothetical protein ACFV8Z_07635 [Streptomyces sp. NPDC059837]|uniref:hypothetical protein n=1 Tax=Streptomyces sp. NPDC059837 TaxID=3346968 RepID=UPI0036466AEA
MSKAATQLDTLAAALADPDSDLDQIADLEDELVAARDTGLIPRLQEHLASAVDAGNSYGRHVLCNILAVTAGSKALPELLRAFARDLGDDQDSLSAILTDFAHQDRAYARSIVLPWAAGPDPDLRARHQREQCPRCRGRSVLHIASRPGPLAGPVLQQVGRTGPPRVAARHGGRLR